MNLLTILWKQRRSRPFAWMLLGLATGFFYGRTRGASRQFSTKPCSQHAPESSAAAVMMSADPSSLEREQLEEHVTRLAAIVDSAEDAILSKSLDGTIISWNKGAERLYGYTREEILGQHISVLFPPEHADDFDRYIDSIKRGERIEHFETVRLTRDGQRLDVSLTLSPIHNSVGKLAAISSIARDIQEQKRIERELQHAKLMAEDANRSKSEFLANMSHEIRTPMHGVIGMTELLLDTTLTPEQSEYALLIRQSAEQLLAVINDILDFSKIEAGKMQVETIDFDLRTVVEDTARLLAQQAHAKDLELACLVEYDVPSGVQGDPGRLRQVLTNLGGNAVKFTEEGEVVLRASLVEDQEAGVEVRFEVTDTGIGIAPEIQERLFHPFSQADTSSTRTYGGTGLGLSISRQLVELMGGKIGLKSEPGEGSTFWFTIPLKKQPVRVAVVPRTPSDLRALHVLIVDDNATNRTILNKQITSWGMRNEEAESAERALERMYAAVDEGDPYDLVILDMQMPETDGMELARIIKADPTLSSSHLVMLTSVGQRGAGQEAWHAGIAAYLTKPVRQSELHDCIAMVMAGPATASPLTATASSSLVTRHRLREARAQQRARILVAEDNPVNQKVAVRMLEKRGFRVDVAANGLEAVEAVSRRPYAAVLMDCQMPEMDGYEATAAIRELDSAARQVPIIAMTAQAMQGDRERCIAAGMDDYVSKPIAPETLDEALARWIAVTPPAEEDIAAPDEVVGASHDVLDRKTLDDLRALQEEDEPDLLAELIDLFLQDTSPRMSTMEQALAEGDASAVAQVAHSLKGSCGNLGAKQMSELCAQLEATAHSGDLVQARKLFPHLQQEYARVHDALSREVSRS
jgi:two-component system, sensor histidine kinase and response regulator